MIDIQEITAISVELTNKCNARCPGCARTFQGKTHPYLENKLMEWSLEDVQKMFPPTFIKNKTFTLGGTVDEPMMNNHILSIVEYIIHSGGRVEIYSNTGCNNRETFAQLGRLSKQSQSLQMIFSVDGLEHTNHLYRINVKWHKVLENMTAYAEQGGECEWHYLAFKHNEHDIEQAKELAQTLNIKFKVRQNMRNTQPYTAYVYNKIDGKPVLSTHTVEPTYNKKYEHEEIDKKRNNQLKQMPQDFRSITCVMLHKKEIFVDWNKKLWPCCWFSTYNTFGRQVQGSELFEELEQDFGENWNDLQQHTMVEILNHPYYNKLLEQSWIKGSKYHTPICFENCGNHGSRQKYKFT